MRMTRGKQGAVKGMVALLALVALSGCGRRITGPDTAAPVAETEIHGEGHTNAQYTMLAQGGTCGAVCAVCQ